MTPDPSGDFSEAFRYWRDLRGLSQSRLATAMGYHRTYISKIETGQERPTQEFVDRAEEVLRTAGALLAAHHALVPEARRPPRQPATNPPDDDPGTVVVVEDHASLSFDGEKYHAHQRRRIRNDGAEPITRYLVRISVDRHPGSPGRSNQLYRANPLTWAELGLAAWHGDGGEMTWQVRHDRDAFKEIWLLFENPGHRFPLYPGDEASFEYSYSVGADKWGQWFQRAVRLPTRHLSVALDFPSELSPVVWGTETTMAADSLPLKTAIRHRTDGGRSSYHWSTDHPPLHARYRLEWNFTTAPHPPGAGTDGSSSPSATMRELGVVQVGDAALRRPARRYALPEEAEEVRRAVAQLRSCMDRIVAAHTFAKGMGLAAPQIGIGRSVVIIHPPAGPEITLINPRVIEESPDTDTRYEGCLSFFDVRGMVERPLAIHVEHHDIDGELRITRFQQALARLVTHEIDHLDGLLYTDRMAEAARVISVEEYRGTGQGWSY